MVKTATSWVRSDLRHIPPFLRIAPWRSLVTLIVSVPVLPGAKASKGSIRNAAPSMVANLAWPPMANRPRVSAFLVMWSISTTAAPLAVATVRGKMRIQRVMASLSFVSPPHIVRDSVTPSITIKVAEFGSRMACQYGSFTSRAPSGRM